MTCSCPLPRTSARAGLLLVFPSTVADQAKLQWLSTAITLLVSDWWYVAPVPNTTPTTDELPKNSPTAGEDCTVSFVLNWQSRPPFGVGAPAFPVGLRILR